MGTIDRTPMERFARAYADVGRRSRLELLVWPGDGDMRCTVAVLGALRSPRHLVISAPANRDHSLIAVTKGHGLNCQWVNGTTMFRFRAVIANLAFEPAPIVYLGGLNNIRRRTLRAAPRALASLSAAVRTPAVHAALVTDLSIQGARIGTAGSLGLEPGQSLELALRPRLLERDFVVTLRCRIASVRDAEDPEHPHICFYGLSFDAPDDEALLVLHACVQQQLAQEADLLTQLLLADSTGMLAAEPGQ